jgi:hypothetical protein
VKFERHVGVNDYSKVRGERNIAKKNTVLQVLTLSRPIIFLSIMVTNRQYVTLTNINFRLPCIRATNYLLNRLLEVQHAVFTIID